LAKQRQELSAGRAGRRGCTARASPCKHALV